MTDSAATLLGAIIGGGFAILGAYSAVKFQLERAAKIAFVETVHEILVGMYPEPINWPQNSWHVLHDKMPQMQVAIYKLRFHLNSKKVTSLDTAWVKYKDYCNKINDAEIQARPFNQESTPSVDQKAIFKKHVDILLLFAE
ncbi:MAG: hypothetical protein HZB79_04240 [Deltaproteobacteria bacterium]|nr:hypothetical protein [Deltaproteobacteria bacterium]